MAVQSTYTNTWGKEFARAIGAPFTAQVDLFFRAWAQAEGCLAAYNPFATTQSMEGATNFNSVGVKNYRTWQDGVRATTMTITNPRYPAYAPFLAEIRKGSSALVMAQKLIATPWGTGAGTLAVLTSTKGPVEWPYGNCYPVPGAPYAHGTGKIRPGITSAAASGQDVDELLRVIAIRTGVEGYKWYTGAPVDYVKGYQRRRAWLWPADGIVGPMTFKSIVGHA